MSLDIEQHDIGHRRDDVPAHRNFGRDPRLDVGSAVRDVAANVAVRGAACANSLLLAGATRAVASR
jgi:hypothetical protein